MKGGEPLLRSPDLANHADTDRLDDRKPFNVKLAILGTGGFIGAALLRFEQERAAGVVGISSKNFSFAAADAANQLATRLADCDAVVLCSLITPGQATIRDLGWRDLVDPNLRLLRLVLDAMARLPRAHLVLLSTDAVYPDDDEPASEQAPTAPKTVYADIHLQREAMSRAALGERCTACRITQVFGANDTHNAYGPCRMVRSALNEGVVRLFGQGEELRDHVSIDDVCQALSAIARIAPGGPVNLGFGRSVSFGAIAEAVIKAVPGTQLVHTPRAMPLVHRHASIMRLQSLVPAYQPTSVLDAIPSLVSMLRAK